MLKTLKPKMLNMKPAIRNDRIKNDEIWILELPGNLHCTIVCFVSMTVQTWRLSYFTINGLYRLNEIKPAFRVGGLPEIEASDRTHYSRCRPNLISGNMVQVQGLYAIHFGLVRSTLIS